MDRLDAPSGTATRRSVMTAQGEQDKLIIDLHQSLNEMEGYLVKVLRSPGGPVPNEKIAKDPSSLLEIIDSHNTAIWLATGRISDILSRLEL